MARYCLADVAALIGEPTRAAMLLALLDSNGALRQALTMQGNVELDMGEPARALAPLEHALALDGEAPDPAVTAELQWALGRALVEAQRDVARGMKLVDTARAEFEHDGRDAASLKALVVWRRHH